MSADNWATCPKCKTEEKLREDFEVGITSEGEFYLYYKATCKGLRCDFTFQKQISESVPK